MREKNHVDSIHDPKPGDDLRMYFLWTLHILGTAGGVLYLIHGLLALVGVIK